MKFYEKNIKDVYKDLKSSEKGISSAEAQRRLEELGKNEIVEAKPKLY